jgi:WD40 repeat protein
VAYDSSTTYYDGVDLMAYTNTETPSVNWNLDRAIYASTAHISGEAASPEWIFFKPDGTKMYIGDADDGHQIYEWDISTAWDLSTRSYVQSVDLTDDYVDAGYFRADGKKLYTSLNTTDNELREYNLSTAWDISTLTLLQSFSLGTDSVSGIYFSPDGERLLVTLYDETMREYELLVPWSITTAVQRDSIDISGYATQYPDGLFFKPDGMRFYFCSPWGSSRVFEFEMSKPWTISTANYTKTLTISASDLSTFDTFFSNDGSRLFITQSNDGYVLGYDFTEQWTNVSKPT